MKANTALCLVLLGIALWICNGENLHSPKRWAARASAVLVTIIGLLTLAEFAFGIDLRIDQLIFEDSETAAAAYPGRIAFTSAINFVLLGIALYVLTVESRKAEWIVQPLALIAGMIALLAIIGYLYDVESLHQVGSQTSMALHSTLSFIALSLGICCARPQKGLMRLITANSVASQMVRRLLSILVGMPIILGWLSLWGQRLGFYDLTFALAFMVILTTALLSVVIWRNAEWLRHTERERKKAEAEVAASQRRFQALIEHAPDGIALLGIDGKLRQVTPSTQQILGYTLTEAEGQDPALLTHPDDLPNLLGLLNELIQNPGQVVTTEYRFKHQDGSWRWLASTISNLLAEPSVEAIVFNYRDVTERKHVQEELRRFNEELEQRVVERTHELELANRGLENSRKEIQAILDSMSTLNAKVARDGTLIFVNKIARQASGLSADELMKTNFLEGPWWTFDPTVQHRVSEAFAKACLGETINYDERIFVFGQVLTINFSLTPMLDENGLIEYVLAEGKDITNRIRAEEEIRRLNQDLERRAAELETVNKELESFSYTVSHDLRAPLRSIHGFSHALWEDYGHQLPDEGRDFMARIQAAAQRMGELVDNLLSLARVTRTPIQFQSVNLSSLAEKIIAELQAQQPARQVTFSIADDLIVKGDSQLLRIALENLIGNAWKFTSKRDDGHIEVGVQNNSNRPIYFIHDNGAGFDMAYKDKLFGTFQRLHSADEYPGTGIGLATVQRIIERHGGRIWAESEIGKGTTFYFTLGNG